jgi:uncharacterized membrane protein
MRNYWAWSVVVGIIIVIIGVIIGVVTWFSHFTVTHILAGIIVFLGVSVALGGAGTYTRRVT